MSFCWGWICILYSHWLFLEKFDPSRISLVKNTLTHGGSSSTRVGESRRKMCRSTFTSPSSWLTCLSRKKFRGDKIFLLGWDEGFGHIVVNQFNEQLEFETMILYDLCDLFELVWWSPVADTDTDTNIPHLVCVSVKLLSHSDKEHPLQTYLHHCVKHTVLISTSFEDNIGAHSSWHLLLLVTLGCGWMDGRIL